jgi:hypothetical protein
MIKRSLLLTGFLLISLLTAYSQVVRNVNFAQKDMKIEVSYDLTGGKYYQYFSVALYVSTDGGKFYHGPLSQVSGDIGPEIAKGSNKKITWDVIKEMPDFGGDVIFDVRATVMEKKIKNQIFIGYKGTNTAPIGIVAGMTGKTGFYISGRLNPGYLATTTYETDGTSISNYNEAGYYTFTSGNKIQRLSITAGLQFQIGSKAHIYAGGGYSQYNLLWQIQQYDYSDAPTAKQWAKHTGESFGSYEAEAGMMYQLKQFFLAAGLASPGFKWVDISFSAGVVF